MLFTSTPKRLVSTLEFILIEEAGIVITYSRRIKCALKKENHHNQVLVWQWFENVSASNT